MMPGMVVNWEEDYCKEGTMYIGENNETPKICIQWKFDAS